uniref:Proline dehydrogenase n=1 Tax=Astyanax mexicanus TaxID=7994 RepID=A0A8B9J9H0_ASTMX
MTALGRPQFLVQFSEVLMKWRCFFSFLAAKQGKYGQEVLEQKLDLEQLQVEDGVRWRSEHILNFTSLIPFSHILIMPGLALLTLYAVENSVRLMVDAEQTYFQPAISRLTLETQRSFNTHRPVIFNTYQCYLKEAYDNVSMDVELSRREGWCFGAKLVRGAYMDQERRRAAEMGYEDPINPDYESTNRMYHSGWGIVNWGEKQDKINKIKKITYNFLALYLQFKIKFSVCVCLGQAGFPVYKYVPYGPVSEVIPYLSRRAQENRGVMKGAQAERELLWSELVRRLTSGEIFNTQSL